MKPRILFVDDDAAILEAWKARLQKQRAPWDMVLEADPVRALALARRAPFDVVVSDMRMPRLDGPALLTAIHAEHPATARIMLSGHGDREAIVRALPAIQQLLSKPCDGATLREAIERGLGLARLDVDAPTRSHLGRLSRLPFAADVADELGAAIAGKQPQAELARIAERDPGLAAKLLQIASSTYFGIDAGVTSIAQAVARIGAAQIAELVLTDAALAAPRVLPTAPHVRRGAVLVRRWLVGPAGEIAYAAALLRDCSEFDRPEASAALLEAWGIPRVIADVVRWHQDVVHAPPAVREMACAVHVADALGRNVPIHTNAVVAAGLTARVASWCLAA